MPQKTSGKNSVAMPKQAMTNVCYFLLNSLSLQNQVLQYLTLTTCNLTPFQNALVI